MVSVKSQVDGTVYDIPDSDLQKAQEAGFKILTPEERQHEIDVSQASVAGGLLEKGLSAATLSGSRYAEQIIGDAFNIPSLSKEAQATRSEAVEKYQPELGVASEIVGTVAPIVLSGGLAAPEVAAVQGAKTAATAGKTALTVADAFNPVGAIAKLGTATAELAEPVIAKSLTGLAATSPRIAQGLTKAGSMAAGGALEGAAFGVGNALDEHALGSEQSLGEAMLHHAGIGALLGGGTGAVIGGLGGLIGKIENTGARILPESEEKLARVASGNLDDEIRFNPALNETQKQGFFQKNFGGLKEDAKDIQRIGQERGYVVLPEYISSNKSVQQAGDMLLSGQPTVSSANRVRLATESWEKASSDLERALKTSENLSELEAGKKIIDNITEKTNKAYEPIKALYDTVSEFNGAVPVSQRAKNAVARNILKDIGQSEVSRSSPAYKIAKEIHDELMDDTLMKDAGLLLARKNQLSQSLNKVASDNERNAYYAIADKLQGLYERSVVRTALEMKTPAAKERVLEMLKTYRKAQAEYKPYITDLKELMQSVGVKKITGTSNALNRLSEINPQVLAGRIFNDNNISVAMKIKKKNPEIYNIAKEFYLNSLKSKSVKQDGFFDPKKFSKLIDGLQKETKKLLLDDVQAKEVSEIAKYFRSIPESFNPSKTNYSRMFSSAFEGAKPLIAANIRDKAISKFIDLSTGVAKQEQSKTALFNKLAKITDTVNKGVDSTSKFILDKGSKYAIPSATVFDKEDEADEKTMEKIKELYEDVHGLNDKMTNSTVQLAAYAPNTANGYKMKSAQTLNYLYNKLPKYDSSLLSPKHKPSKAEIYKFNLHFQTVKDPFKTMKKAKFGALLPEEMDTLKNVYPDILEKTQLAILNQMQEIMSDDTLSYQNKIGLSSLLEKPLINSLQPKNIAMNQIKTNNQKQAEVQKGISKAPNLKSSYMTSFQRSGDDVT